MNFDEINKLALILITLAVVIGVGSMILENFAENVSSNTITSAVTNEAGAVNGTGYTLATAGATDFASPTMTALLNGTTLEKIHNETIAYANGTGYTVAGAANQYFTSPALLTVYNRTGTATLVNLNNFSISAAGVLQNKTLAAFDNLSITYSYIPVVGLTNVTISAAGVVTNTTSFTFKNLLMSYIYTQTSRGESYTTTNYLLTQLGQTGLAGWVPAIIAFGVGIFFLAWFLGSGRRKA